MLCYGRTHRTHTAAAAAARDVVGCMIVLLVCSFEFFVTEGLFESRDSDKTQWYVSVLPLHP